MSHPLPAVNMNGIMNLNLIRIPNLNINFPVDSSVHIFGLPVDRRACALRTPVDWDLSLSIDLDVNLNLTPSLNLNINRIANVIPNINGNQYIYLNLLADLYVRTDTI